MTFTAAQKAGVEDIINILCTATPPRGKRQLAAMFLELVDRTDWPQYYEASATPVNRTLTRCHACSSTADPGTTVHKQHPRKCGEE
jgi:hypothetical protein